MSFIRVVFVLISCLWVVFPAQAAELQRFMLNGKEIIIFDDKTWDFAETKATPAPSNCTVVKSEKLPVSICLDPNQWTFANLSGDHEFSIKLKDKELYLLIITEKQFIELDAFKKAIIANAQAVSGLTKVKTEEDKSLFLDFYNFRQIVYSTNVDGIPFTFNNYYSNLKGQGSFQFVFFAGRDDYPSHQAAIAQAISGIKVTR